jgi:hypothetical protein
VATSEAAMASDELPMSYYRAFAVIKKVLLQYVILLDTLWHDVI